MNFKQDKIRKNILITYCAIFAVGLSYLIFIRITGLSLPCVYNKTFGFLCPGCGITRMFVQLSKFNIGKAFMYNPACFILIFFWIVVSALMYIGKPSFLRKSKIIYGFVYFTVAVLFLFGILRNVWVF